MSTSNQIVCSFNNQYTLSIIMAHRRLGHKYDNDPSLEDMKYYVEEHYKEAVTLPVNMEIEVDHRVLNYDTVKQYLTSSNKIVLLDCECRTNRRNCDALIRTCIGLNEKAERLLNGEDDEEGWPSKLNPTEVTIDEALRVLEEAHEAGLVHMAYTQKNDSKLVDFDYVCSCCTCCCGILAGVFRYGLAPHLLTSDKTEVTDSEKCTLCGVCVDRCQFGAREIVDDSMVVNSELCFGCGLCVSTCSSNAITLIEK